MILGLTKLHIKKIKIKKKQHTFIRFSRARTRARSLCCVVSADVTAGTALSRGVSKSWDSSYGEKRETDRSESIKLLFPAAHSEN